MSSESAITISTVTLRRMLVAVVVAALVVAAVVLLWQERDRYAAFLDRGIGSHIQEDSYQAVFLTGGQVFFGRLESRGDVVLLSEVFYLQTAPDGASGDPGTLVKRGNEVFGPTEPMIIPKDQVVFFENLRDDSQVVQAIRRFSAGETAPRATPRPSPTVRPSPTR